jgi:hypothetical protein
VLVPSLLAERSGWRLNERYLAIFLGTRLGGYLVFALIAWELGTLVSVRASMRAPVFGGVHLLLAVALLWYARAAGRACARPCAANELVSIGLPGKRRSLPGAAVFGFLTGISLCPPFVAAGIRAAELGSLAAALVFFALFFAGTSIWFVPFVGLSCVRRNAAVTTVARMAMVLIACYYAFLGIAILAGRHLYGL